MRAFNLNSLAVTFWFLAGSLAVCLAFVVDAFTAQQMSANPGLKFWVGTTLTTCGVAGLAGALVDILRFAIPLLTTRNRPQRARLARVMKQNPA